ncbi:MAG: tetratricopeptide repeat-containing sulfotransferase family protein [Gammaproteobacteria bacterium]
MNPELTAALGRCNTDPDARRILLRCRRERFDTASRVQVAERLTKLGLHRLAALWLVTALRQAPPSEWARVAYLFGNALRRSHRDQAAARVLEAVCARAPDWNEPARSLAWLYRNAGQVSKATAVVERQLAAGNDDPEVLHGWAGFLFDMGQLAQAEVLLARVENPPAAVLSERGNILLRLGRFEEGETVLREALRKDSHQNTAWLNLVQVRRWSSAPASPLADLEKVHSRPELSEEMRAAIGFALVKVNDDLGRYRRAWEEAVEANRLRSRSAGFDRVAWKRYENAIYEVFDRPFLERMVKEGDERPAPVFIVGMPRSGTTLIERRLGWHSRLEAVGELEVVEALGLELAGGKGFPRALLDRTANDFAAAARHFQQRIPRGGELSGEVVDKNPFNFLHLGLIASLFPQARIVHCRRDPLDTALSLWFQNFAHHRGNFSYRMGDLAWMFGLCRRLMAWWERVLPVRIYTLDYENLVANPEPELRALVGALGLQWEPSLMDTPARSENAISTASMWQARQPVYTRSVGRAQHYEPWIAPLRSALAHEGVL